jgi:hypothetical protein
MNRSMNRLLSAAVFASVLLGSGHQSFAIRPQVPAVPYVGQNLILPQFMLDDIMDRCYNLGDDVNVMTFFGPDNAMGTGDSCITAFFDWRHAKAPRHPTMYTL